MIAYSTSGPANRIGFGMVPCSTPIVNVPGGCTVARIRCRPREFITVYLRRGQSFEAWMVDFANDSHTALKLLYPVAANIRP